MRIIFIVLATSAFLTGCSDAEKDNTDIKTIEDVFIYIENGMVGSELPISIQRISSNKLFYL
jgi:hypothetical protein